MESQHEMNKVNALALSKLILDNPNLGVIAWINSDNLSDEYGSWAGNIGKPTKQTIAYSKQFNRYIEKDGYVYQDCYEYYESITDEWDDETLNKKAKEIPLEYVIAVGVSAM